MKAALVEQLSSILDASKTTMIQMREGGVVVEMAKLYAKFVRELQAEGFTRDEAMKIVVAAQLGQQK